ncbi:hypothetical protein [Halococcoides cellulosivorans]|uniref:DUF8060 domain-containing protein n=1 Tax=Halococcoides cellulosivorans TaxID=1679096 RepID=A0A2R4WYK5_9EURY|nr:hypothetical protein [Halococcoides cellulosivorans]AWB26629.1 hypothetical protein HARCEL1_02335 [Halococcoides cellulosivorans]
MTDHDAETTTDAPSASTAGADSSAASAEADTTAASATTEPTPATAGTDADGLSGERVVRAMEYTALAGLSLLAVIAVIGAYVSANGAINVWVGGRFQPIFHTVFNLVVLGVAGIGISLIVRRRFDV